MSNINFTCPHCSHTTQLTSDRVGTKRICPSCKMQVVITPEFPNPPPLSKPPPINPITDKSDRKVQNEVWKQPAAVVLSIVGMTGVVVFLLCLMLGASLLLLINRDAGDDQSSLVDPDIIKVTLLKTLTGHSANIESVAFSSDGHRIVTGSNDTTAKLWDAKNGDLLRTLTGHSAEVCSVAFSPDGNRIVTGSDDKKVKIWNANSGQLLRTLNRYGGSIQSVAFSPDGTKMGYGGISYPRNFRLHICDANTGDLQRNVTVEQTDNFESIHSVVFSPDSKQVATGSDKWIKIWNASTGDVINTIKLDVRTVNLSFSPDGNRLAVPDKESVRIFDAKTCDLQRTITGKTTKSFLELMNRGYSYVLNCVAFSPDGNRIVTGSNDRAVKIWNANTGERLATLNGHTEQVNSVAFSPDGKRIVSVSDDETVKIWNVR